MSAWATNQMIQVGGLYRVRYTGQPLNLPLHQAPREDGVWLAFSDPLDRATAEDVSNFKVTTWELKRSHNYGSKRYDVRELTINSVFVEKDGKGLLIELPEIQPTWVMEIQYDLRSADGKPVQGSIQSTIYGLEETEVE